jgi:hypothetical protein
MVGEVVRDLRDRAVKHKEDGTELTADGDPQFDDGGLPKLAKWIEILGGILKLALSAQVQSVVEEPEEMPWPSPDDIKRVGDPHKAVEEYIKMLNWTPPQRSRSPNEVNKLKSWL